MGNIFDIFNEISAGRTAKSNLPVTHIIVGLGNPGEKYANTRHNAGFRMLEYLSERCGIRVDSIKFKALVGDGEVGGRRVLLMKPQTYMNNSGVAIGEAAAFYKITPDRVLILHDEISFEPGMVRIRRKGSAGGHNGLKSIIAHLASEDFPRVKIGVGKKPTPDYDLADWVLGKLPKDHSDAIAARHDDILDASRLIADGKIDDAMQKYSK